jgi:murein DD-endopeptidase MepM/ murein hydrolase activator NlpD
MMKLPLWQHYAKRPLTLRLTPSTIASFVGAVSLISITGLSVGYVVGAKTSEAQPVTVVHPVATVTADQQQAQQLKAMNERMAEMQARLLRLDALGQHMAENAHINSQEFELNSGVDNKGAKGGPLVSELSMLGDGNINVRLQELSQLMEQKEAQLQALDSVLMSKRLQNNSNYLANLPVRKGTITSTFGYRTDPFTGHAAFHAGMDFSGAQGTDIYTVASGVVSFAGIKNGYGNVIEVNHGNGYVTRYAHAQSLVAKVGDMVAKDQLIAYMGSTGRSTGTHLHYEVIENGKQIDPATYVNLAMKSR